MAQLQVRRGAPGGSGLLEPDPHPHRDSRRTWRGQADLPEHGAIAIFNRSYYEAVLIERVHPKLLQGEGVDPPADLDRFFENRLRAIRIEKA